MKQNQIIQQCSRHPFTMLEKRFFCVTNSYAVAPFCFTMEQNGGTASLPVRCNFLSDVKKAGLIVAVQDIPRSLVGGWDLLLWFSLPPKFTLHSIISITYTSRGNSKAQSGTQFFTVTHTEGPREIHRPHPLLKGWGTFFKCNLKNVQFFKLHTFF